MPVIRNPFKKNIAAAPVETKTADPLSADQAIPRSEVKTPAISILSHREDENDSYKLCVVNGSGEYLPPSPPEKKGFWKRSNSSTSFRREVREALRAADNEEGFTISRDSFEGYRRSFDISARSPVIGPQRPSFDSRTSRSSLDRPSGGGSRTSLDRPSGSRTSLDAISPLRQSFDSRGSANNIRLPPAAVEETASDDENEFKDVDLNDNGNAGNSSNSHNAAHHKKKGFLARFGGGGDHHHHSSAPPPPTEHSNEDKTRSRSSTLTWKKDLHNGSEELGDFQPDTQSAK